MTDKEEKLRERPAHRIELKMNPSPFFGEQNNERFPGNIKCFFLMSNELKVVNFQKGLEV